MGFIVARAVRLNRIGGPEVLRLGQVEVGEPGPGEARVRHTYVAVNFIDITRTGRYRCCCQTVSAPTRSAWSKDRLVPTSRPMRRLSARIQGLFGRPCHAGRAHSAADGVGPHRIDADDEGHDGATSVRQVYPLKGGETILYHAAAGGVGLIACQWSRALGVTMIGTVSTDEKAAIAKANGCAHTIVTSREDVAKRVREITGGKGVPVAYDSVGKDTLMASLDSLQPRGTLVSNGTVRCGRHRHAIARGQGFTLGDPSGDGSLRDPASAHAGYGEGAVRSRPRWKDRRRTRQTFALADAAEAHRALESRKTTGATVLVP
jgi:NADPH2:quinone reductase